MNEPDSLAADGLPAGEHHTEQQPALLATGKITGLAILRCGGAYYGIDVKWVREIRPFLQATPVYGLPAFWVGITALRGQLYAVLDLHQFLCPQQAFAGKRPQVVFTVVNTLSIGLLVDVIPDVYRIDAQSITAVSEPETPYVLGTTPDQITVLDLPALFANLHLFLPAKQADNSE